MKKHVLLCLILIFSLFSTAVLASDIDNLKLQLEMTHVMMEVGDSIDQRLATEKSPFENPDKLAAIVREEAMKFEQLYEKSGTIPEEKIPALRKFFSTIKWDNLVLLMKKAHIGIDIFFKRKGYGFGIAVMLAKATKFSLVYFCMKHNLQALIPVVMNAPWLLIATVVPVKLQQMKIDSEVEKVLRGKEQLTAFREQEKKMLEVLQLSSEKDFLLPLETNAEGATNAVVVKNNPVWKKFLNFVGMKEDELTLINLKRFLKEQKVESGHINWVLKNKALDDSAKTALISLSLFNNDELRAKFQLRFKDQFREFAANKNWDELFQWTRKMKEINEVDKLIAAFNDVPSTLKPKEVAQIWNDVLFPEYIAHLNINYEEGRNLVFQSDALRARLSLLADSASREEIQQELLNTLGQVLSETSGKRCQMPAALIGEKLLQSF